jgi:L-malate glycosyltransferase
MRVLLINHCPLDGSGSGTYTKNIALHLQKRGHRVSIIFPENQPVLILPNIRMNPVMFSSDTFRCAGMPFNFPCFTTHPQSNTTFADLGSRELTQYLTAFSAVLRREVRQFQPDIIHSQHAWCLSWLASLCSIPLVVTIHGTDLMGCIKWPGFCGFAQEAVAGSCRVLAVSEDNCHFAARVIPSCREKITVLPNGYNEDVFFRQDVNREALLDSLGFMYRGEYIVFFAGKLTPFKGVDTLLKAAQCYESLAGREIITLIAGDGEEMEKLSELHKALGLKNTFFLGNQNQDILRQLYNAADVFVMPSRNEPFGLVALEAMACGLPVVASNGGGLPEFINSDVGTLVSPDDVEEFCGAILEELAKRDTEPGRREHIARYARENFAQAQFVTKLEDIYRSVIETASCS